MDQQFANVKWIFFDRCGVLKDEFEIYHQIARSATSFLTDKDIAIDQAALPERLLVLERQDTGIRLPQTLGEQGVPAELIDEATTSAETAPALLAQTPYEGVAEVLIAFCERYGLGVISNGRNIARTLERENIDHFFGAQVGSSEFGYSKPHPKIFEGALKLPDTSILLPVLRRIPSSASKAGCVISISYSTSFSRAGL
jgi:FMN phosphatase YigB (HAD superfamily)